MVTNKRLYYGLNDKPPLQISIFIALQNLILDVNKVVILKLLILINVLNVPTSNMEKFIFNRKFLNLQGDK